MLPNIRDYLGDIGAAVSVAGVVIGCSDVASIPGTIGTSSKMCTAARCLQHELRSNCCHAACRSGALVVLANRSSLFGTQLFESAPEELLVVLTLHHQFHSCVWFATNRLLRTEAKGSEVLDLKPMRMFGLLDGLRSACSCALCTNLILFQWFAAT